MAFVMRSVLSRCTRIAARRFFCTAANAAGTRAELSAEQTELLNNLSEHDISDVLFHGFDKELVTFPSELLDNDAFGAVPGDFKDDDLALNEVGPAIQSHPAPKHFDDEELPESISLFYSLSSARGAFEAAVTEFQAVGSVLSSEDFRFYKQNLSTEDYEFIIEQFLEQANVSPLTASFVSEFATDQDMLVQVNRALQLALDEQKGVVRGSVVFAQDPSNELLHQVENTVASVVGAKKIIMSVTVNPALLGGFVARFGAFTADYSAANQIDKATAYLQTLARTA